MLEQENMIQPNQNSAVDPVTSAGGGTVPNAA